MDESRRCVREHRRVKCSVRGQNRQEVAVTPAEIACSLLYEEPGSEPDQIAGSHSAAQAVARHSTAEQPIGGEEQRDQIVWCVHAPMIVAISQGDRLSAV